MTSSPFSESLPAILDAGECELPQGALARAVERFWAKVDASGECWIWTGQRDGDGYGQFSIAWNPRRRTKAHRMSWLIHYGQIPNDLMVCHHCDNPRCVRPDHLFLGTMKDNALDAKQKGRLKRPPLGRRFGPPVTRERAEVIKAAYLSRAGSMKDIALQLGVGQATVFKAVHHVDRFPSHDELLAASSAEEQPVVGR